MNATLFVSLLALAAPAPAANELPKSPPPRVGVISIQGNDRPVIMLTQFGMVQRKEKRTVIVEGKQQTQEFTVPVAVPFMLQPVDGKELQVFGLDGKKIDAKELARTIRGPTPVLVSADGQPVDPFYLKMAKEGTLVLVGTAQNVLPLPEEIPNPPARLPIKKLP